MSERKLILYIAMSLDGYIAGPGDDLNFLSGVEKPGEDYGYAEFTAQVDAVILGKRSIDKVKAMGYDYPHSADKDVYVITRNGQASEGRLRYYTGALDDLVKTLKQQPGKNIYCDGGAFVANAMIRHDLIDTYIISVIPVLLGDGIRLFQDGRPEQKLTLVSSKQYETGLLQLHYERLRPENV